jgi:hypothetical protein
MAKKKILFISWQGCMGHVTRDVAIAREIHRQLPEVELVWLASPLATQVLEEAGEEMLPESALSADYNEVFQRVSNKCSLSLMKYTLYGKKLWDRNVELFKQVIGEREFDLVIGDEIYELEFAIADGKLRPEQPMAVIHDFLGVVTVGWNPFEKLVWYLIHRKMVRILPHPSLKHLFVGEFEDILDRTGGPFLPNWRELAEKHMEFLGHAVRFDPADYADRAAVRARLGYGTEPLVVCALGGASVGTGLLELCGWAYPIMREQIPDLRMVAVGGGMFSPESVSLPPEVTVKGYVPDLHEHFAASDLTIIIGGGTSATELTALKRPFIYFPLEGQFDQQVYIPERLARHRAGIRMAFGEATSEELAKVALENIGAEVDYADIPLDGAKEAARIVGEML